MSKKESQEQLESFRISDIDQVKALSHPLRMRIIETLALGEKPTRLYHHVGLLQKAGLIRLTHTQQNRGTTEKYYEPIARQFRADADLFADESPENQKNAYRPMIRTIFDNTSSEMLRLVESNDFNEQLEEEGLLSYLEMHIPQKNVEVVRDKLKGVLDYLESLDESEFGDEELREMRLTVALYPLDRFE